MDRATIETLASNCKDDDERQVILELLKRQSEKPAVVVTMDEGSKTRRYVVVSEDADEVRQYVGWTANDMDHLWTHFFGARWLRGYGRVDEMYRSLSLGEVVKVEEIDAAKVWGS